MSALESLYPGDRVVEWIAIVTVAVALISTAGWLAAKLLRRHSATRHMVLLVALLCALASPLVAALFVATGTSLIAIEMPSGEAIAGEPLSPTQLEATLPGGAELEGESAAIIEPTLSPMERDATEREHQDLAGRSPEVNRFHATVGTASAIWLGGTVCLLAGFLCSVLRVQRLRRNCRPVTDGQADAALNGVLHQACARLGIVHAPAVLTSAKLRAPVALGFLHPVIVLPVSLLKPQHRSLLSDVLVHELAHVVRRDHLALLLQSLARAAYWPIVPVHFLNRALASAREEVCDSYVLASRDAVSYGETLLCVAELANGGPRLAAAIGVLNGSAGLEERIKRLVDQRRNNLIRVSRMTTVGLALLFAAASLLLCGTTLVRAQTVQADNVEEASADPPSEQPRSDPTNESGDDPPPQAHVEPIRADSFFIAPILTDLQKRKLGVILADGTLVEGKDYVAYMNLKGSDYIDPQIQPGDGLRDPSGQTFDPIRRALTKMAESVDQGKLRVSIDYGHHLVQPSARRMVHDVIRGMAIEAGFTGADVYGTYRNPIDNNAVQVWNGLPTDVEERPQDERKIKVGGAAIYPVTTALSRYRTNNADLYITIEEVLPLVSTSIFSEEEIAKVREAIEKLDLQRTGTAQLYVSLEEPDVPYEVFDVPHVHQDAAFHWAAVELLKDLGFDNVNIIVRIGGNEVSSPY